ncbi:MAG: glycosyltransferase [Alsobacter sp.]
MTKAATISPQPNALTTRPEPMVRARFKGKGKGFVGYPGRWGQGLALLEVGPDVERLRLSWPVNDLVRPVLAAGLTGRVQGKLRFVGDRPLGEILEWFYLTRGASAAGAAFEARLHVPKSQLLATAGELAFQVDVPPDLQASEEVFIALQLLDGPFALSDLSLSVRMDRYRLEAARVTVMDDGGLRIQTQPEVQIRPVGLCINGEPLPGMRIKAVGSSGIVKVRGPDLWSRIWAARRDAQPALEIDRPFEVGVLDEAGVLLGRCIYDRSPPAPKGKIERAENGLVRGWAMPPVGWPGPVEVELRADGVPFGVVFADRPRSDLIRAGLSEAAGGFEVRLPAHPLYDEPATCRVELVWRESGKSFAVRDKCHLAPERSRDDHRDHLALSAIQEAGTKVAIVIPVHNAARELANCLASVKAVVRGEDRLVIVVDDGSTDPDVGRLLADVEGEAGFRVIRHDTALGFSRAANRGIEEAGKRDVLLLNADTILTPRVVERLRLAAYRDPTIATVTPLSNRAGPFSIDVPFPEETLEAQTKNARIVARASARLYPVIPTGHGFCLYIKRRCLDQIGLLDADAFPEGYGEENDFCMRAYRAGWMHVLDDSAYVYHVGGASFGERKDALMAAGRAVVRERYPEYKTLISRMVSGPELRVIRSRVLCAARDAHQLARPRYLYVIARESGGTPLTNVDLMNEIGAEAETYLLRTDGKTLVLEQHRLEGRTGLLNHHMREPVTPITHRSAEHDRLFAAWVTLLDIDLCHVRHIAWHSLGLFDSTRNLGMPVVLSFHDFYFVCPTIKLLDESFSYCGGTCTAGEGRCKPELWRRDEMPTLKHAWVKPWRERLRPVLATCHAFVTTSERTRGLLIEHFPELAQKAFHVVPHGRTFARMVPPKARESMIPLRLVVPGNIGTAKGANILKELKQSDIGDELEIHVVGHADPSLAYAGIHLHGSYERDTIVDKIASLNADLGAVLSIWPETYCHTLTELWAAGLPVIGFDFGAVGERISATGAGWLISDASARQIAAELKQFVNSTTAQNEAYFSVARWQSAEGTSHTATKMGAHYASIYNQIQIGKIC